MVHVDFDVNVDDAAFSQVRDLLSSIEAGEHSQFVSTPTNQAGQALDLILGVRVTMDLTTVDAVP